MLSAAAFTAAHRMASASVTPATKTTLQLAPARSASVAAPTVTRGGYIPPPKSPLTSINIAPSSLSLASGTNFHFNATGYDKTGQPLATQPSWTWSVLPGGVGGTVSTYGVYTAPLGKTGTDTLQAWSAGISKLVTVNDTPAGIFTADGDVGSPTQAGHFWTNGSGTYTLSGSGTDIWSTADQFNFATMPLTGDGIIEARVLNIQNTNYWAKTGIMFRSSMSSTAMDAYVTLTPHGQVQFLDRPTAGAAAVDTGDASNMPAQVWEKIVRVGNTFSGFWSADGTNWNALGSPVTINMGPTVYVGLVSSSANTGLLNTSQFDNVSVYSMPTSGVYRIDTRGQTGMSLDVEGFANANGTHVSLYTAAHTSNQQWLVQAQTDGTFKIYAYSGQNSLQMLDYAGGSTANGNTVSTYEDNGTNNQRWIFLPVGGGYYRIVPKNAENTLQTLDINGGNTAGIGARTQLYSYWGGDNQVFKLDAPGTQQILPSPKKGLAGYPNEVNNIHPSWIYNWGGDEPAGLPSSVEFTPMAWSYYGNANNNFSNWLNTYVTREAGVKTILGFNEPDSSSQANLTVAQALDGWQYLNATGLPLGSPAGVHADDQWMKDFMSGAAAKGYRVDYVTIHWYGGNDPAGFINYVNYIHTLYNKPVWITEFAPADWSGNRGISTQQAADFMRAVIPQLNQMSFVQRYSWFSASTGDAALGAAALYNGDGSLTDLGKLYARM